LATWEHGSIVAVQTGRDVCPIRVARVNSRLWNEGRIWDTDEGASSPDEVLNLMGREGWELVSVVVAMDGWDDGSEQEPPTHRGRTLVYYMKRPIPA
jgi:hypothetical protein